MLGRTLCHLSVLLEFRVRLGTSDSALPKSNYAMSNVLLWATCFKSPTLLPLWSNFYPPYVLRVVGEKLDLGGTVVVHAFPKCMGYSLHPCLVQPISVIITVPFSIRMTQAPSHLMNCLSLGRSHLMLLVMFPAHLVSCL
jgi:hypothetical protein